MRETPWRSDESLVRIAQPCVGAPLRQVVEMNAPIAERRRRGECATFGTGRRFRRRRTGGCHMRALGGRGHLLPGRRLDTKLQLTDRSRALWARDVVLSQTRGCRAYSCLAHFADGFLGFAPFWNVWLVELIPHTIFLKTHHNCVIRRSSECPASYSPACVGPIGHDSRLVSLVQPVRQRATRVIVRRWH